MIRHNRHTEANIRRELLTRMIDRSTVADVLHALRDSFRNRVQHTKNKKRLHAVIRLTCELLREDDDADVTAMLGL